MNEPRNSPARRRQFLFVCVIGFGVCLNALIHSGLFTPVIISEGVFPGGLFVYKAITLDYTASFGSMRRLSNDLFSESLNDWGDHNKDWGDILYCIYLDDETQLPGGKTRYLTGALFGPSQTHRKTILFDTNERGYENKEEGRYWKEVLYEEGNLPGAKAAIAHFPYTHGFVSALILSHKVIPAMHKYAKEHAEEPNYPIVIATCSVQQQMCTYFAPLQNVHDFALGRPDTDTYLKTLQDSDGSLQKKEEKDVETLQESDTPQKKEEEDVETSQEPDASKQEKEEEEDETLQEYDTPQKTEGDDVETWQESNDSQQEKKEEEEDVETWQESDDSQQEKEDDMFENASEEL